MTRSAFNLALLLAGLLSLPGLAQEGGHGLCSDIEEVERRLQMTVDPAGSLVERLSNIEKRVFGVPQTGSLAERLRSVMAAVPPRRNQPGTTSKPPVARPVAPPAKPAASSPEPVRPNPNASLSAGPGWVPSQMAAPGNSGPSLGGAGLPSALTGNGVAGTPSLMSGAGAGTAGPGIGMDTAGSSSGTTGAAGAPSGSTGALTGPAGSASALPAPVEGWQPGWQPKRSDPHRDRHPAHNGNGVPPSAPTTPLTSSPAPTNSPVQADSLPGALQSGHRNFGSDSLPLLNAFPPNLLRMESDKSGLIARPDYYGEVTKASKGKVMRFKTMPIPVYIQPFQDRAFLNCVVKAFESWEMRTDGAIKFSQIDNPNQARIQVIWRRLGTGKDREGCLLGAHTILKYTSHGNGNLAFMNVGAIPVPIYIPRLGPKYSVPPQVMEINLDLIMSKEPSIRYACLQNIATHELGHALGMLGHSPDQADIMYSITDEHSRLSERDINTLIKLYRSKCDIPL